MGTPITMKGGIIKKFFTLITNKTTIMDVLVAKFLRQTAIRS